MELLLKEQDFSNEFLEINYEFTGVPIIFTHGFVEAFDDQVEDIAQLAILTLIEQYPQKNWQYLQVFSFNDQEFWCISDSIQGAHSESDRVMFLLPEEY